MNAEEFKRKFKEYAAGREPAFYWEEMPKTEVWFDDVTNELCSSVGIRIKCDDYIEVCDCVADLYESIVEHYIEQGIYLTEATCNT